MKHARNQGVRPFPWPISAIYGQAGGEPPSQSGAEVADAKKCQWVGEIDRASGRRSTRGPYKREQDRRGRREHRALPLRRGWRARAGECDSFSDCRLRGGNHASGLAGILPTHGCGSPNDDGWAIASHIALSGLTSMFPFLILVGALTGFVGSPSLASAGDAAGVRYPGRRRSPARSPKKCRTC